MNNPENFQPTSSVEAEYLPHVAYGPVRSQEVMERIVGSEVRMLGHVGIKDTVLVEQSLGDVTDVGDPSPQAVLEGVVNPDSFRSLGAVSNQDSQESGIGGTLFALTPEQKARLDAYELVPEGWFERTQVDVVHPNGEVQRAETHVLSGEYQASRKVKDEEQHPLTGEEKAKLLRSIDRYNDSIGQ